MEQVTFTLILSISSFKSDIRSFIISRPPACRIPLTTASNIVAIEGEVSSFLKRIVIYTCYWWCENTSGFSVHAEQNGRIFNKISTPFFVWWFIYWTIACYKIIILQKTSSLYAWINIPELECLCNFLLDIRKPLQLFVIISFVLEHMLF